MMEGGSSFRIGSLSIWRNTDAAEIFSDSFHQEDDEEALKWAAIQNLPTFARLRKGLLTSLQGEATEIDIENLGLQERKDLLERLVRLAEEDNEKFLLKLKKRIDRVGIDLPTIEVRFEHLNIEAEAHVGSRSLPTFTNFMVNIVEGLLNSLHVLPSRKQQLNILRNVSGIIKPSRMTLLLGPPSSGKTTLLLALAGKLDPKLKFYGKVTYNGHEMNEFVPQRTAAYVDQHDLHIGEMTVRETLAFSARVQGVGPRYDLLAELSRREKDANIKPDPDIDVYMKREYLLMKRNSFVYIFKLCQLSLMAIVAMTIFLRTEMHRDSVTHGGIYVGALFFGVVVIMFNGMAEISLVVSRLPVFYKQRGYLFYPPWAFALPSWILKIPLTLVEAAAWVFLTYYVIGFDPYIGRFFRQYLILVLVHQMASALFRLIAAVGRDMNEALTLGSFVLAILFAMSGFVLSKDSIKKGWIWGFWISPMMYGQNAMVNNEFLGNSWKHVLPNSTEPLGVEVLKSRGYFTESYWYWIGVVALIGYTLVFNFGYVLALTFLNPLGKHQTVIPEESQNNEQNGASRNRTNVLKFIKDSFSQHSNRVRNGECTRGSVSPSTLPSRQETVAAETNHSRKRGMVLSFEPHSITFDEVTYSVGMPQEMKNRGFVEDKLVLLKGVSGAFRSGVLTALMGVTGAGKTTLMDVLAGRKTGGYIEGNITISGYPKKQETFARISGYCEQNDIHSPYVTVYESLLYSAWLRLSPDINAETRKMFIEEVMELVELKPLRNALVGLPGVSGLSTEQRKRLTIAVELVANPSIIFMDEPTSGLDARAAAIVMRTVRNTVDTGRTVVCTIHQPSIDIFESFDELLLLKQGGQEIYVGPLGQYSSNLIGYFEGIQGVSKIKDGYNPATWMLEVTTPSKEVELGIDFAEVYKNSELYGEKEQDLFNAMGSMYAAVLLIGIKNSTSVQPVVSVERTVFYRERAAGKYSAFPYAFGQVVIELPYVFVQTVVYCFIVYAMIGFEWNVAKVLWCLFFMYFTFLYFTFYGMMSVAMTPNSHISTIVSSAFYAVWNLFSGFIIPRPRIPVWWRWYSWINPVAWSLYGLVASQYGDIKHNIDTNDGRQTVEGFVRNYFGFKHDFLAVVAVVNVAFPIAFALVFAISIKMFNFQRR
ncbi:pleiotropic drug resistance protein 1-like [Trifolium pratense]|uniref:pleiotropic drug resistance protein 1-like n=1 Tax=Trifolium pratense TaxID=57577 RepID=UPI001E691476|nr:pleiotropic drug resistance protein 1-like [Trifolium pratense]